MTKAKNHDATDRQLDEDLRRALDPDPGAAERLAQRALEPSEVESRQVPWLRPALVAVALLALVTVSARVIPHFVPQSAPLVANRPAVLSPADDDRTETSQPPAPRLSISNLDGPVTVTTADGTRWIALSPDTASSPTGDPIS